MLALEVFLNNRKLALAGADDLVVLSSIVSAVGKLGRNVAGTKAQKGYHVFLHVGGLTGRKNRIRGEHLAWIEMRKLKVGDKILVRVRKVTEADPPIEACPEDIKRVREEREEFRWVKARYLKLRRKYER